MDTVVIAGLLVVGATIVFGGAIATFIINDNKKHQNKQ
jgi:hypothetical protein